MSNLKPANFRGVESQGMLLAAEKDGTVKVLDAPPYPGDSVGVEGIAFGRSEVTIEDFKKVKLTTRNTEVVYAEKPLVSSHGKITVNLPDGAVIR